MKKKQIKNNEKLKNIEKVAERLTDISKVKGGAGSTLIEDKKISTGDWITSW